MLNKLFEIIMKKIIYLFLVVALLSLASCTAVDNWDAPDCRFHGTVIDSYTNQPLLTSQNDWQIRMWERSYAEVVSNYQTIPIKQDGSYNDSRLFAGTYDMLPFDGPFWPVDTVKNVQLKSSTEQNFTVTPYLQIVDFKTEMRSNGLYMSCRLKAPLKVNNGVALPNLVRIQGFVSHTVFCGNGSNSYINLAEFYSSPNIARIEINRSWSAEMTASGIDPSSEFSKVYTLGPFPLKSGYTYHVRMGANVNVLSQRFNYSPIEKIVVP